MFKAIVKRKELLYSIVLFVVFSLLSTLAFAYAEGLTFLDALYFTSITLSTVGYGDVTPQTVMGKLLVILSIVLGIAFIAAALTIVTNYTLQKQEKALRKALASGQTNTTSGLSHSSLSILMVLGMIAVSSILFILLEDMALVDAVYFAVVSCSTVGYGDFAPKNNYTKVIASILALVGTVIFVNGLSSLSSPLLASLERERLARKLKKLTGKHKVEKLAELDEDGDGQVDELEFVSAMLIKLGKVSDDEIQELRTEYRKLHLKERKLSSGALARRRPKKREYIKVAFE